MKLPTLAALALCAIPLAAQTICAQTIQVNKDNRTIAVTSPPPKKPPLPPTSPSSPKVGPLVYASNQVPQRGPFAGMLMTETAEIAMRDRKANLKPLAIVPEKLTRSSTVYAVFAIE